MNSNLSLNLDFKLKPNFEGKPLFFIFERQIMHVLYVVVNGVVWNKFHIV